MPNDIIPSRSPRISVLMPAYNAAPYIGDAIRSVLDQPFGDFELIVYNDGSTDGTQSILGQFSDTRLRVINQSANRGLAEARRATLKAATGKYIAILDSDDVSFPERLSLQHAFMEAHSEVALCGGNAALIDGNGKSIGELLHPPYKAGELKARFFFDNIFVNSSVMFRRREALHVGGYRDMAPVEDYDLFVRLADQHSIHLFNRPLVYYRVHEQSVSQTRRDEAMAHLRAIKSEQLRLLGVDAEAYAAVFNAFLYSEPGLYPVDHVYRLLMALKTANRRSGKLPLVFFEKELYDRWYKLVLTTTPGPDAVAYLLRRGLVKFSLLSCKQKRRILKLWLKSLLYKNIKVK